MTSLSAPQKIHSRGCLPLWARGVIDSFRKSEIGISTIYFKINDIAVFGVYDFIITTSAI